MSKKRIILLIVALSFLGLYYVWAFMLSLNREVTDAFQIMNERLIESNRASGARLDSLKTAASNTNYSDTVLALDSISTNLIHHIDALKMELTSKISDPTNYNEMDNSSAADELFFSDGGYSEKGNAFLQNIDKYQIELGKLFQDDFPEITSYFDNKLNRRDDIDDWLEYNFKGFPLVATLTRLTQIQADVTQIEKEILKSILENSNN